MGASTVIRTHPWCDNETLKKWVQSVQAEDAFEHGSSYSGHWNMCTGLAIHSGTVFESEQAAEDFLLENMCKWEDLVAVPARFTMRATPEQLKADSAYQALLKVHADLNNELWRFPLGLVTRAKEGKSAYKACSTCGSKISVKHLSSNGTRCPVCSNNLLITPTDTKKLEALKKKVATAVEKLKTRESLILKKISGTKTLGEKIWVVGGICAS